MVLNRETRQLILDSCEGRCAYCGVELSLKTLQVDHVEPRWHGLSEEVARRSGIQKGSDELSNLLPSCARCNRWKSTWSLAEFRRVVQESTLRLARDTPNYRLAKDFGLVQETGIEIRFWFEQLAVHRQKTP